MANESMQKDWAAGGVGWAQNQRIFDAVLAPFGEVMVRAADLGIDHRVLDIGCGTGALLEQAVALGATAVGVDISQAIVDAARQRVPTATVSVADAQTVDLRAAAEDLPFDRVVSRFGVMFFDDPVAAFTNIRAATAPGAVLAFVCWRNGDNPMFTLGNSVLTDRLQSPSAPADPVAPGPLAFGDAQRARAVLSDACRRPPSPAARHATGPVPCGSGDESNSARELSAHLRSSWLDWSGRGGVVGLVADIA